MWKPRRLTTLWASTASYRNGVTLFLVLHTRQQYCSWPLPRELHISYGLYFVFSKLALSVGKSGTDDSNRAYCVLNHAVWTSLSIEARHRTSVPSLCLRYTNLMLKVTHWSHWTGATDIIPLNGYQTVVFTSFLNIWCSDWQSKASKPSRVDTSQTDFDEY
jgi:hypothetical protein